MVCGFIANGKHKLCFHERLLLMKFNLTRENTYYF